MRSKQAVNGLAFVRQTQAADPTSKQQLSVGRRVIFGVRADFVLRDSGTRDVAAGADYRGDRDRGWAAAPRQAGWHGARLASRGRSTARMRCWHRGGVAAVQGLAVAPESWRSRFEQARLGFAP